MGQHGDHTVRQVHARPPLERLPVQRTPLLHIVRHIRDMHAQPVILPFFHKGYRIIQVFRVFSVDRHHLPVPQVFSPRAVRLADRFSDPHSLFKDFLREFRLYPHIHHDRKDIRTRIIDMSDDLRDFPLRLHMLPAIGSQLHCHLMPGHRSHFLSGRDIDVVQIPLVIRADKTIIPAALIQSHYARDTVRDDAHDLTFPAPAVRRRSDDKLHFIPLEGSA